MRRWYRLDEAFNDQEETPIANWWSRKRRKGLGDPPEQVVLHQDQRAAISAASSAVGRGKTRHNVGRNQSRRDGVLIS